MQPSTQARDLIALREAGYMLKRFKLVDQFPHTAHVESVALLEFDPHGAPYTEGNTEIAAS